MIATLLSPPEGLLVAREQRAGLPNLSKTGRLAPENMMLVAQSAGEHPEFFSERVLQRAHRELQQGRFLRAVVVTVQAAASPTMLGARRSLIHRLAEMLASRPDGELIIQAPGNASAADRIALFELVETTMAAAPNLQVRLSFSDPAEKRSARLHSVRPQRTAAEA